ncbi:thioredoxin family protein [Luteolibacter luteus]|uniref:Thioredoxin family protein n=1 Tax=Luteolibacter luteus TaxID=2728835 RepID=A0A858RMD0_9BACT|nr:thioredoxin family protein [Luteolibacter luteus]QJE97143.1 thioredoxin family protein [Luteolibacter luteus]
MPAIPLLPRVAAILALAVSSVVAADWSSDYEAARKQAATEKKDLLIDFTGSDWCTWCIKLRQEVFEQAPFEAGVKDRYLLVELDYPKDKSRLTEAVAKQNEELLKKYPIKSYPSILLCDADGKPFAVTGYQPGGPEAYLKHLEELQARKVARDKGLADAGSKTGVEKAKLLIGTLEGMQLSPEMLSSWYGDVATQIKEADPADETGFAKREATQAAFAGYMTKLMELRAKQDLEAVAKLVEETLANPLVKGEVRTQVYGHHAGTLAYAGKKDEAIKVLQTAVKDPDAEPGRKELEDFIKILEREKAGLPPVAPEKKN